MTDAKDLAAAIGERIATLRDAATETQEQLAQRLKVSVGTVSRWERGDALPRAEHLATIAEHYNVTPDYLFLGTGSGATPIPRALHKFLATPMGVQAQERGLVTVLLKMSAAFPDTPTVRTYELLTTVLLQALAPPTRDDNGEQDQ